MLSTADAPRPIRRRERCKVPPLPAVAEDLPPAVRAGIRLHVISGRAGALWRALVDAGIDGIDEEALGLAVYGPDPVPASWGNLVDRHIKFVRAHAAVHGLVVDRFQKVEPRRWRLRAAAPSDAPPIAGHPQPEAGTAARAPVGAASSPEDVRLSKRLRVVWGAMLDAGPAGTSADDILAALHPDDPTRRMSNNAFHAMLTSLRQAAGPQGFTVAALEARAARPRPTTRLDRTARASTPAEMPAATRWRIVRVGEAVPPTAPAALAASPVVAAAVLPGVVPAVPPAVRPVSAPAADPAALPLVRGVAPASRTLSGALSGAAGAVAALARRDCRWPIGDVGDADFRFCCAAAVPDATMPYCPEHCREASAGHWSTRRAA